MVTFSKFGSHGKLGNQLFQYASLLGIANIYDTDVILPKWEYASYFANQPKLLDIPINQVTEENGYIYDMSFMDKTDPKSQNVDIVGWLQSEKYWIECVDKIKESLRFDENVVHALTSNYHTMFSRPTIAIAMRRGDYVDNPNYEQLPIEYYYLSLFKHFPDIKNYNIFVSCDNLFYSKRYFDCFNNVYYDEGLKPIEKLIVGSMCDNFIIANSTFCWWMAYFGELRNKAVRVIRPKYFLAGELLKTCDDKDFWPNRWEIFDHKIKSI